MKPTPSRKALLTRLARVGIFLTVAQGLLSCSEKAARLRLEREELSRLVRFTETHRMTPAEIIDRYTEKPGTLLVTAPEGYCETPELIRFMIPVLHRKGITELGVFFISPEGAGMAEALTEPGGYSDEKGNRVLFLADPAWGYAEYRELFSYTAQFNALLEAGEPPFRLKPLYRNRSFHTESAAALTGPEKTTVFIIPQKDLATVSEYLEKETSGQLSVLMLYGPLEQKKRISLPWKGMLDKTIKELRPDRIPCALPLVDLPHTEIFRPAGSIDAILLIRPSRRFKAVTPIENFITRDNREEAMERFPEKIPPKPIFRSIGKMNRYISSRAAFWKKGAAGLR